MWYKITFFHPDSDEPITKYLKTYYPDNIYKNYLKKIGVLIYTIEFNDNEVRNNLSKLNNKDSLNYYILRKKYKV